MFTFLGNRQRFCDGMNRRNFLRIGAFGATLSLADVLRLRAATRENPSASTQAKARSAIMIYLPGGPSHMDMYDLKPEAPAGVPRRIQTDQHQRPRRADLRALPAAGEDVRQARRNPLDRLGRRAFRLRRDDRLQRKHQPPGASSLVRVGDLEAARRASGRHPAVRQSARHVDRQRARLPGHRPSRRSLRTVPAWKTCGCATAFTAGRMDDRKTLLTSFDTVRRDIDAGTHHEGDGLLHGPGVRDDRLRGGPQGTGSEPRRSAVARSLQGDRAIPDGPPAGGSGRRLRDPGLWRLGHPRRQLQALSKLSFRSSTAASPISSRICTIGAWRTRW